MKTTTLIIGAVIIGGGLYLCSQHEKAAASSPSLEARANAALLTETNPFVLTSLAQECLKAGRGDLAKTLQAKAELIFTTTHTVPASQTHPATAPLDVAVGNIAMVAPSTLSLAQAVASGASDTLAVPSQPSSMSAMTSFRNMGLNPPLIDPENPNP